jgi:hypothetical protein
MISIIIHLRSHTPNHTFIHSLAQAISTSHRLSLVSKNVPSLHDRVSANIQSVTKWAPLDGPHVAGFYSDPHCVHLKPGTGHLSATFEIYLNSCGMSSSANHNAAGAYGAPTPSGSYVENTIIIQYDPYVQEVWDQARKLRCTWWESTLCVVSTVLFLRHSQRLPVLRSIYTSVSYGTS